MITTLIKLNEILDSLIKLTKEDGTWGNMMKERKLKIAIKKVVGETKVEEIMELIKHQDEYR